MEAVRHWLRGGTEDQGERIADLVKFGASEADARAFVAADAEAGPAVFGVWPQNELALGVFIRLARQWLLHPQTGRPVGLCSTRIESTLRLMRVSPRRWPVLFDQIRVCEDVVLAGRG